MPRSTPAAAAPTLLLALLPALLLAALVPLATPIGTANAAARKRADLTVVSGDVDVRGARVTGSFTVHNQGARRAKRSSAAIKVDGERVRSVRTPALGAGARAAVRFSARVGGGTHRISVCADRRGRVDERREGNNCRTLGTVTVASTSVPTDPVDYEPGGIVRIGSSPDEYWVRVPTSYDDTHRTPIRMVVFVHGCGASAQTEAQWIDSYVPAADDHLLMVPGLGHDGQCWDAVADAPAVLEAVADARTHFNVDPKRVVIGGYSSGSTLAGQVAFTNAELFAGVYAIPGRLFWHGDHRADLMKSAAWKLNVALRPHAGDEYYPISELRGDKRTLADAGFPVAYGEIAGSHAYLQSDFAYVFGKADGWVAP